MKDNLGDRMKFYESSTEQLLLPKIPVFARIDGRAFHTFTKGLARPYDERLSNLMVETTKFLVDETNARCGYTQSDEISLVWLADMPQQLFFGGRLLKMVSILSAMASVTFNRLLPQYLPEKANRMPIFDCRVWNIPTEEEASNCFVWREMDATRNSVSMAAQAHFSHKQLQGKSCSEMHEMLFSKGINWNDFPDFFKRGTYVRRKTRKSKFTTEEIERLPPKHEARTNPNLEIVRSVVESENLPPLTRVANREGVILRGEEPLGKTD